MKTRAYGAKILFVSSTIILLSTEDSRANCLSFSYTQVIKHEVRRGQNYKPAEELKSSGRKETNASTGKYCINNGVVIDDGEKALSAPLNKPKAFFMQINAYQTAKGQDNMSYKNGKFIFYRKYRIFDTRYPMTISTNQERATFSYSGQVCQLISFQITNTIIARPGANYGRFYGDVYNAVANKKCSVVSQ